MSAVTRSASYPFAFAAFAFAMAAAVPSRTAAQSAKALATALANPVASLISVPFQGNWDRAIGADEAGRRFTMNVQPVIPFELNRDWNLIAGTILPVIDPSNVFPGGDIVTSNDTPPTADALTAKAGKILAVGKLADLVLAEQLGTSSYARGSKSLDKNGAIPARRSSGIGSAR